MDTKYKSSKCPFEKSREKIKTQKISATRSQIMFEIKITWWGRGSPKHNLIQLLFSEGLISYSDLESCQFLKIKIILRKRHWGNVSLKAGLSMLSNIKCQFLRMPHSRISELLPFISIRKCQFLSLNGCTKRDSKHPVFRIRLTFVSKSQSISPLNSGGKKSHLRHI